MNIYIYIYIYIYSQSHLVKQAGGHAERLVEYSWTPHLVLFISTKPITGLVVLVYA